MQRRWEGVYAQCIDGESADGHDPRFSALADDSQGAVLEIDRRHVEAHEFRQAQSRGVEELHDGLVARGQSVVGAEGE